jgi:hypothetical protein
MATFMLSDICLQTPSSAGLACAFAAMPVQPVRIWSSVDLNVGWLAAGILAMQPSYLVRNSSQAGIPSGSGVYAVAAETQARMAVAVSMTDLSMGGSPRRDSLFSLPRLFRSVAPTPSHRLTSQNGIGRAAILAQFNV